MTQTLGTTTTCTCQKPIPVERAERKGAAVRVCLRCGLEVPARLPAR